MGLASIPFNTASRSQKDHLYLVVKIKLSPCSGSVALRELNPVHKKGPKSFKFFLYLLLSASSHQDLLLVLHLPVLDAAIPHDIYSKVSCCP